MNNCTGEDEDHKAYGDNKEVQNQKDKRVVSLNTATNNAGCGFGVNGLGSNNLGQSDVPDNLLR